MPYARRRTTRRYRPKTRPSYRKRYRPSGMYRKKRRYAKVPRIRSLWQNPLPLTAKYRFTYNDTDFSSLLQLGGGYQASRVFSGNSLFDPDTTGVGVQPYGYDQYCGNVGTPFSRYRVFASKITIYPTVKVGGDAVAQQIRLLVFPLRGTTAPSYTGVDDMMRLPFCKVLVVRSSDNNGKTKLGNYCTTRRILPDIPESADLSALYNANPNSPWSWHLYIDTIQQGVEGQLNYDVKIVYYARLIKNNDINES